MRFCKSKTAYVIITVLAAFSLVFYSFGYYSVQAAEVSNLPADIDITVNYDADNISFTYGDKPYSFSRSYSYFYEYDGVIYYPRASYPSSMQPPFNLYYTECTYPAFTVELDRQDRLMGTSYWFSPSGNALYILESVVPSSDTDYISVRGFTKKDGHGCFIFDKWSSSKSYYNVCYRYDFTSGICTLGWVSTGNSNDSRFRTSYNYYDLSSGFTYYGKYNSQSDAYWANGRDITYAEYFPADLLCLYSNYPISGFYEPDMSKVETPDYYMQYQYIFYRKDKGYTFVDSARPLTEITAQGSYAYLTFSEVCNKYIYTSVDGTAWTLQTDASSMYGSSFTQLSYDWLYDNVTVGFSNKYNAELVYTNDDKFGKSTKEWKSLYDVIEDLPELHGSNYNDKPFLGTDIISELGLNDITLPFLNAFWGVAFPETGSTTDYYNNLNTLYHYLAEDSDFRAFYSGTIDDIMRQSLLSDKVTQIYYDDMGLGYEYTVDSLRSLIKGIHSLTEDTNTLLSMLHNDFVGVNDNLSILYDYTVKEAESYKTIISKLSNIEKFDGTFSQLSKDMNSGFWLVISEISGFRSSLSGVSDSLNQIQQAINNIDLSVKFPESEPKFDLFYDDPDSNEDLIDFVSEYAKTALDKSYFASYLSFDNDTMSGIRFYNGLSEDTFKALGPLGAALLVSVGFSLVGAAIRKT